MQVYEKVNLLKTENIQKCFGRWSYHSFNARIFRNALLDYDRHGLLVYRFSGVDSVALDFIQLDHGLSLCLWCHPFYSGIAILSFKEIPYYCCCGWSNYCGSSRRLQVSGREMSSTIARKRLRRLAGIEQNWSWNSFNGLQNHEDRRWPTPSRCLQTGFTRHRFNDFPAVLWSQCSPVLFRYTSQGKKKCILKVFYILLEWRKWLNYYSRNLPHDWNKSRRSNMRSNHKHFPGNSSQDILYFTLFSKGFLIHSISLSYCRWFCLPLFCWIVSVEGFFI